MSELPKTPASAPQTGKERLPADAAVPAQGKGKRPLPIVPIMLAVNTGLVVFAIGMIMSILGATAPKPQSPQASYGAGVGAGIVKATTAPATQPQESQPELVEASWKQAQGLFASGNYAEALGQFHQLLTPAQTRPGENSVTDVILLRQAQCLLKLAQREPARALLASICDSSSALVRAMANQAMAQDDLVDGRWGSARLRCYKAIAAVGMLAKPMTMENDCDYVIAYSLTQEALSLSSPDLTISLANTHRPDSLADLDEAAVQKLVDQGGALAGPALAPEIKKLNAPDAPRRYQVRCSRAALEDLLGRFGAQTGLEIRWTDVAQMARRRTVTLSFDEIGEQRAMEIACGMAGLIARFTGDEIVIHDPQTTDSLSQRKDLLCGEAMSVWRRMFLRSPNDARIADGQFALGILMQASGDTAGALTQYHMTASRYEESAVAPRAMLESAKLRMQMGDYYGAHTNLVDLLDSHPQYPQCDQAYLRLGEVALKTGQLEDAARCYRKLFYLNLSNESKRVACLGLGRTLYQSNDFKEATKWFKAFLELTKETSGDDLRDAYFLLGQCEAKTGNASAAVQAMQKSIAVDSSKAHALETLVELAKFLCQAGDFVGALGAVSQIDADTLNEQQTCDVLILQAKILCAAGLTEKACTVLRSGMGGVSDPQRSMELEAQLAFCKAQDGDLNWARTTLTGLLPRMSPGPTAWEATCQLADICLRNGQAEQTIALAQELLKTSCGDEIRRRTRQLLAAAYLQQKDYAGAASVFAAGSSPKKEPAPQ